MNTSLRTVLVSPEFSDFKLELPVWNIIIYYYLNYLSFTQKKCLHF